MAMPAHLTAQAATGARRSRRTARRCSVSMRAWVAAASVAAAAAAFAAAAAAALQPQRRYSQMRCRHGQLLLLLHLLLLPL